MKVRLSLDVDTYTRYVVARYFRLPGDKPRPRATRQQVRRFVQAALHTSVREQAEMLPTRAYATAKRLAVVEDAFGGVEYLAEPREKQRSLAW